MDSNRGVHYVGWVEGYEWNAVVKLPLPYGTVFLKLVDASDVVKDATLLFELLDSVVEEVGEDLVIQVVTDNASNYKKAGEMLMKKRTRLWWTPCIAHCIDLILEKIRSLPQHENAFKKSEEADWWTTYVDDALEPMGFAVKVLSLTCSSSTCERN
ncbi:hypothetical protein Ddye_012569 [Dipteronia dyeriana]|uniref:DUF659 domain-containing protein n=1 Tax=Dipteronia dyeriana TaxID=168575 RepID=A0AAD9X4J8_9ROSI|nr:hypothetical protein Ddye_012569 [Dipteronia dyeriana]